MVEAPYYYRRSSYRSNAVGQANSLITHDPLYLALGSTEQEWQSAYRVLFCPQLDRDAIENIRRALSQSQPAGNERCTIWRGGYTTAIPCQSQPGSTLNLVSDNSRLFNPGEWLALQEKIRSRYAMAEEVEMFEAVMAGMPVQEALDNFMAKMNSHSDNIGVF